MAEVMEMKVTAKKGVTFYMRSAVSFLQGVPAREATEGKEATEAKPPVDELKISGLGEAINIAVAAATNAEKEGCGKITKVETNYPNMANERGCAQIEIHLKRVDPAAAAKAEPAKSSPKSSPKKSPKKK